MGEIKKILSTKKDTIKKVLNHYDLALFSYYLFFSFFLITMKITMQSRKDEKYANDMYV